MNTKRETEMMNNTANTTAATSPAISMNEFHRRAVQQAEKEIRIKKRTKYTWLSSFDMELLRDIIVDKAVRKYYDIYDPSLQQVEAIVHRIAHNEIVDYVKCWYHTGRITDSLDRLDGWTYDSESSDKNLPSGKSAKRGTLSAGLYDSSDPLEDMYGVIEYHNTLRAKLSDTDYRIICMLESEWDREAMADEIGCTYDAICKRVHEARKRAMKALGLRMPKSRKTNREVVSVDTDDLSVLFMLYGVCSRQLSAYMGYHAVS